MRLDEFNNSNSPRTVKLSKAGLSSISYMLLSVVLGCLLIRFNSVLSDKNTAIVQNCYLVLGFFFVIVVGYIQIYRPMKLLQSGIMVVAVIIDRYETDVSSFRIGYENEKIKIISNPVKLTVRYEVGGKIFTKSLTSNYDFRDTILGEHLAIVCDKNNPNRAIKFPHFYWDIA